MKPVLRVVAGADAPAGKWRRPKRHHVVGGAVIAAALALGGWLYLHPLDPPKLNAMHTVLILAGIWLLAKFIQGWWEGPQREPDQVVHHVHTHRRGVVVNVRNILFAAGLTAALLAASPAKAEIFDDDLDDLVEDLLEGLAELLLAPLEALPGILVPDPLPPPILGDHVFGVPVTTQAAIDLAEERLVDRTARVDALNEIGALAAQAATVNAAALELLNALNLADPISVAASQTITAAADIAGAVASAVESQVEAAQTGLDADRAQQETREEIEKWQSILAHNPGGQWAGVQAWAPETIGVGYSGVTGMLKLAVAIGVAFGIGFFAVLAVWIERERDEAWQETIDRNLAGVWTGQRSWKPETIKLGF